MRFIFVILVLIPPMSLASLRCEDILLNADWLAQIKDLAQLKLQLEQDKANGKASLLSTAMKHEYAEKESVLNAESIKNRLKKEIQILQEKHNEEKKEEQKDRQNKVIQTRNLIPDGSRAIFNPVLPGTFMMGNDKIKGVVKIEKPFEMMATKTTQIIWKKIADLINSKIDDAHINPDPSFFKGDLLPVETLSYGQIYQWIDGLNELSKRGDPELTQIIPDHKKGDVYRLPTNPEWEFVVRARGAYVDSQYCGNTSEDVNKYVWSMANSNDQTQPVAQLEPLVFDNVAFYDLIGNTYEWVSNPDGINTRFHALRGAAWDEYLNTPDYLGVEYPDYESAGHQGQYGFRLVRIK